jgi:NAD(P)-dependent dehydrogenase (short-subunit alcohol dehydrogenase family)
VTPLTGAYNASKFALEAVADALRLELHPWGIDVVVVEPAQTDTDMWQLADQEADKSEAALAPELRTLYRDHIAGFRRMIPKSQKMAVPADDVAAVVERALTAKRPKARYVVGTGPKVQASVARVLPTRVLDTALRKASGIPNRT